MSNSSLRRRTRAHSASGSTSYPSRWLQRPPGCSSTTRAPARGSSSRPATLARPHALAATATARARTARQTCRNRPTIATSTPQVLKSPQKPRGVTQSTCTCVMHALRAGRGAHCPSVFVCVAHLSLEMIYLFLSRVYPSLGVSVFFLSFFPPSLQKIKEKQPNPSRYNAECQTTRGQVCVAPSTPK